MKSELTLERLHAILAYDPLTGHFTAKVPRGRVKAGERCGYGSVHGYRQIRVDGVIYYEHRLAWFYSTGEWPDEIDHRNEIKSDNRIQNLREASRGENLQNRSKAYKNNATGILGVSWNESTSKWTARIVVDGERHLLGEFDDPESAKMAYQEAKRKLHPFAQPEFRVVRWIVLSI